MPTYPPRPKRQDPEFNLAAAKKLAPAIIAWMDDPSDDNPESIAAELADAMRYDTDGYKLAKSLDVKGWDPDSRLVEILDDAAQFQREAWVVACAQWVQTHQIPEPPPGSEVRHTKNPERGIGVVQHNHSDGTATVRYAHLGQAEKCGYVLPWEELEFISTTETQTT